MPASDRDPVKQSFDPATMAPDDAYKLLIGLVVPRPIGWIGTMSTAGVRNLAPYSFFNAVSGYPPTVMFSPGRFEGRRKDSWANAEDTGEFTANIVGRHLAERMNVSSGRVDASVDEFALAGLTAAAGAVVNAPMVAEADANLECRVTQIVPVGREPRDAVVILGEVVRLHIRTSLLDGTRIDQAALDAIGRMGGPRYTTTADIFEMIRPD